MGRIEENVLDQETGAYLRLCYKNHAVILATVKKKKQLLFKDDFSSKQISENRIIEKPDSDEKAIAICKQHIFITIFFKYKTCV